MEIAFWAATDVGRVREHNEDNFLVDKRLRLFIVCDGMGGHAAGEVASAMSVRIVREVVSNQRELIEQVNKTPHNEELCKAVLSQLEFAIKEANRRVFEASRDDEGKRGMGTTCCVLLLTSRKAFVAHVGDSRVYLLRQTQVLQLTEDHSLYNEMVRLGKIRRGDKVKLPNKNAVTRAVGVREQVEVDTLEFDLASQDRFLVCSDGLCGYFKAEEQIRLMMTSGDVKEVTELSIAFALESGGKDNVTAILVDVLKLGAQDALDTLQKTVFDRIDEIPYFQYLTDKERKHLVGLGTTRQAHMGETIFSREDADAPLCVVIDGELEVLQEGRDALTLHAGDCLGAVALIDGQATPRDGMTTKESLLFLLSKAQFTKLLQHSPELAVKLMWNFLQVMASRVRDLEATVAENARVSAALAKASVDLDEPSAVTITRAAPEADDFTQTLPLDEKSKRPGHLVQSMTQPSLDSIEEALVQDRGSSEAPISQDEPTKQVRVVSASSEFEAAPLPKDDITPTFMVAKHSDSLKRDASQASAARPSAATTRQARPIMDELRQTIQLDWAADASGELRLNESTLGQSPSDGEQGAPPPLPVLNRKMPPLPPLMRDDVAPLGRGISGVSSTKSVEAEIVVDPSQSIEPTPLAKEESAGPVLPDAESLTQALKRARERAPTARQRSPRDRAQIKTDLLTTVQLDVNDLHFDED